MKKNLLAVVLSICLLFTACAAFAEADAPRVTLYANGGTLLLDGAAEEAEYITAALEPGQTFGEALELARLLSVDKEGSAFLGWTVYAEDPAASVNMGGVLCFEMVEGQPAEIRTYVDSYWMIPTEELAEIVCEEVNYIIVADWVSEDEEYFEESEDVVLPSITLLSGEGTLLINGEEEQYETTMRVMSTEPGISFGGALELDAIAAVTAEGKTFAGWTVYEYDVETMETVEAPVEEEGVLCFELFEGYYMVLRDYEICEELISTEELADIICGAPDHVVIANFE